MNREDIDLDMLRELIQQEAAEQIKELLADLHPAC